MKPKTNDPSLANGDVPESFGLENGAEDWMDRVREAETPSSLGCIGPYELIAEASRGGQGIVYRARQPGMNRSIAVKRLLAGSLASPSMRKRFEREIELASSLNHPNIVTVHGIEVVDGQPLLAMEWIDGVPLDVWASADGSARRSPREIADMLCVVCDAVRHAHQRGIIHRDLKPSNILVDKDGVPHVLDFGLARSIAPGAADGHLITLTEQFVGTPAFASPEHLRGGSEAMDVRADVYSLGVLLYNALTGQFPYDVSGDLPDVFRNIEQADPIRPSSVSPRVDREIESITLKALRKDKQHRYQTVDALGDDLRRYLQGDPIVAHPPSTLYQIKKMVQRHRWPVVLAMTLFVVVSGAAVWMSVLYARASVAERRATAEAETANQASAFLTDLFRSSDPFAEPDSSLMRGQSVTVREILDAGAERIKTELADQPAVRAKLLGTIGNVYLNLASYGRAAHLLEEGLSLRRRLYGEEHIEVADGLADLGLLRSHQGHFAESERLLREALGMYRSLLPGEHLSIAECMLRLGRVLQLQGDFQKAEPHILASLEISRNVLGEDHPDVAKALTAAAFLLLQKGNDRAAEPMCREALAIQRKYFGDEHPIVAVAMGNLALVLHATGDSQAAEALYTAVLAMNRKRLGEEHSQTAITLHNLAGLLQSKGDYDGAIARYEQALSIKRKILGQQHASIAKSILNLGSVLHDQGDYGCAESSYREALDMSRKLFGEEHQSVAVALRNLGLLLAVRGDYQRGESMLRKAIAVQRRILGEQHWVVAQSLGMLADLLARKGDHTEAESLFVEALVIYRNKIGVESRLTLRAMNRFGEFLLKQNKVSDAEPLITEALAVRKRILGEEHPETLTSLANMGWVYWARGNLVKAEPYYRETMEGRVRVLGENHPHTNGTAGVSEP